MGTVPVRVQRIVFGSALGCAFPGCAVPAVTWNAGSEPTMCECAHIRSHRPGGPRYDASYGDPHVPENLLLLCGLHHPLVDGDLTTYTVEVLEEWRRKSLVTRQPSMMDPAAMESLMVITRAAADLESARSRSSMKEAFARIEGELTLLRLLRTGGVRAEDDVMAAARNLLSRPGAGMGPQMMENAITSLWEEVQSP